VVTGREDPGGGRPRTGEGGRVGVPKLVFGILGSAVAWAVHFNLIYFLNTLFCTAGWRGADLAVLLSAVPFAGFSAAAGIVAYRRWREVGGGGGWENGLADPGSRIGGLFAMGAAGSVLFTVLIGMQSLAPLFVPTCAELQP
jgi:hypothetical protein